MNEIVVGTRRSALALTQTQQIVERLQEMMRIQQIPVLFKLATIETRGDREVDVPLSKVGGKGLFVKEIEHALLDGEIDFAVHSLKDMPYAMPEGLMIGAIPLREDARDCLVMNHVHTLDELPKGAVIGTSSLRRASQLQHLRPDCVMQPIRGNIDSRLRKLEANSYDAIVLAAAGMHRMGWHNRITCYLPLDHCLPAVGQGALCIQCRSGDSTVLELLRMLQHEPTALAVRAERSLLGTLQGGCQLPIGAYATIVEPSSASAHTQPVLSLTGMVATLDGSTILKKHATGVDPERLGEQVANQLLANGAASILAALEEHGHESN